MEHCTSHGFEIAFMKQITKHHNQQFVWFFRDEAERRHSWKSDQKRPRVLKARKLRCLVSKMCDDQQSVWKPKVPTSWGLWKASLNGVSSKKKFKVFVRYFQSK